jgi:hypothetical protein
MFAAVRDSCSIGRLRGALFAGVATSHCYRNRCPKGRGMVVAAAVADVRARGPHWRNSAARRKVALDGLASDGLLNSLLAVDEDLRLA